MTRLIAEDLLLLLLEDESGKPTNTSYLDIGIGGGLLVELALGGHVEVVKAEGMWARAKEIADGDWSAKAVRDAVSAAQAAVMAATMVATTAAATSG